MNRQFLLFVTVSAVLMPIGCMETSKDWGKLPREMQLSIIQKTLDAEDININVVKNGINATDQWGNTALIKLAVKGDANLDSIAFLILNGAQINNIADGRTALYFAAVSNASSDKLVKYLVEHGADINLGTILPLYGAAVRAKTEMVQYLIRNGADLGKKDKDGYGIVEAFSRFLVSSRYSVKELQNTYNNIFAILHNAELQQVMREAERKCKEKK